MLQLLALSHNDENNDITISTITNSSITDAAKLLLLYFCRFAGDAVGAVLLLVLATASLSPLATITITQ